MSQSVFILKHKRMSHESKKCPHSLWCLNVNDQSLFPCVVFVATRNVKLFQRKEKGNIILNKNIQYSCMKVPREILEVTIKSFSALKRKRKNPSTFKYNFLHWDCRVNLTPPFPHHVYIYLVSILHHVELKILYFLGNRNTFCTTCVYLPHLLYDSGLFIFKFKKNKVQ